MVIFVIFSQSNVAENLSLCKQKKRIDAKPGHITMAKSAYGRRVHGNSRNTFALSLVV